MSPATAEQVLAARTIGQRLHPHACRAVPVAEVLAQVCGVQAQDAAAADLAVRARRVQASVADIERARLDERAIVRTWAWRGTLHLLAAADLPWVLPLIGPVAIRANRRRDL